MTRAPNEWCVHCGGEGKDGDPLGMFDYPVVVPCDQCYPTIKKERSMADTLDPEELRVYVVVRNDIKMPLGKAYAQVGHAVLGAVEATRKVRPELVQEYLGEGDFAMIDAGHAKIALRGKEKDLRRSARELTEAGIPHALIQDAGRTVFPEPTLTCLGFGPIRRSELPKFVQKLQLHE